MSTTYTPVPGNAPATITLPSDLDAEVAESVNAAFRAIADNLFGLTALLGHANVFTAAPQAINVADAALAALVTRNIAADDANGANIWKAVLGFNVGTYYVNVYAGRPTAAFQFIIAVNAVWDPASQTWASDDHTAGSIAILMSVAGAVEISHRAPGAGSWSTWPTNGGDLNIGGAATIAGALVVSGALGASGVSTSGDYAYGPVKLRTSPIPIADAIGDYDYNSDGSISSPAGGLIYWPIRIPRGFTYGDIQILHEHTTVGSADVFNLFIRTGTTWSSGSPAIPSRSGASLVTAATGSGLRMTTLSVGGTVFTNDDDEVELVWGVTAGATSNKVHKIRMVNWQDAGLSNV